MTNASLVDWTDNTFNTWWGCARESPACQNCYAAKTAARWGSGDLWHRKGPRRMMSESYWREPLSWNRKAEQAGKPLLVFCASMADVFEIHPVAEVNAQLDAARGRLWALIERTPWLTWQLLTKRPQNIATLAPWGDCWPTNVWLGTSVEDNRRAAERIPVLSRTGAKTLFLSCEPLLEEVDLHRGFRRAEVDRKPDWVIIGGESGAKARTMDLAWVRSLIRQCRDGTVPVFVKQLGTRWAKDTHVGGRPVYARCQKGNEPADWPADLRIREWPAVAQGRAVATRELAGRTA